MADKRTVSGGVYLICGIAAVPLSIIKCNRAFMSIVRLLTNAEVLIYGHFGSLSGGVGC